MTQDTEINLPCPGCGRVNQVATGATGDIPEDGDVSICWGCGVIGIFAGDPLSHVRHPTDEERRELMADEGVQNAVRAIGYSQGPVEAVARFTGESP